MNGMTRIEALEIWELMVTNERLWALLLKIEPRLTPALASAKERLYAAELFSNLVQALMGKGW